MGCQYFDFNREGCIDYDDMDVLFDHMTGSLTCSSPPSASGGELMMGGSPPEPGSHPPGAALGLAVDLLLQQQSINVWADGQITPNEIMPLAEVYAAAMGVPWP